MAGLPLLSHLEECSSPFHKVPGATLGSGIMIFLSWSDRQDRCPSLLGQVCDSGSLYLDYPFCS